MSEVLCELLLNFIAILNEYYSKHYYFIKVYVKVKLG